MKKLLLLSSFLLTTIANAQALKDSLPQTDTTLPPSTEYRFRPCQVAVPASMILVGYMGVKNGWLHKVNKETRDAFRHQYNTSSADNYLQYLPLVCDYGLSALGAKAKHGYGERTIALATSYLSLAVIVNGLKLAVDAPRPYGGATNSFPSGHTATAFMGAEIIRQEYGKDSPLYGIAAYAFAVGIGYARIYNDRHWLTDVIAGAGVGILSARMGYWMLPCMNKLFQRGKGNRHMALLTPFYGKSQGGITFTLLLL